MAVDLATLKQGETYKLVRGFSMPEFAKLKQPKNSMISMPCLPEMEFRLESIQRIPSASLVMVSKQSPGSARLFLTPDEFAQYFASSKPTIAVWKHQDQVNRLFKISGLAAQNAEDFATLFEESSLKNWLDVYNSGVGSAQDIEFIAKFYIFLRKRGFSHAHIISTFTRIAKIPGTRRLDFIRKSVENSSKVEKFLGIAGKGASAFDAFITLIDIYDLAYNGEWSQLAALVYKKFMGKAIPLAGLVDALQSFVEALVPGQRQKSSWVFKVIRSCDPVGLGGAGVDSMGFLAQAMIDKLRGKPFNEKRFDQLIQRLRTGPTAIFSELGDRISIGELIYDIGEKSSSDWQKLWQGSLHDITSYVRRFKR